MQQTPASQTLATDGVKDLHEDLGEISLLLSSLALSLKPKKLPSIHSQLEILTISEEISDSSYLRKLKRESKLLFRNLTSLAGSLLTSDSFQSPSFFHSVFSEAGSQEGKIIYAMNDYKRDYHLDGIPYEQKFKKEYIDCPFKFPIHMFLVNSGMAALSTILTFLHCEEKLDRPVLVGENTYFQSKELIVKTYDKNAILVREDQTAEICLAIATLKPSVLFLDSLTNTNATLAPNLTTIIDFAIKTVKEDLAIVIDNTCLSLYFQPMRQVFLKAKHVRIIVYESLNKYHEFGTDRVTAGIIWAYGKDTEKLFEYRKNCGTNISDTAVYALPVPSRKLLTSRLARFERNAKFLTDRISQSIKVHTLEHKISIQYPGLPTHPSYTHMRNLSFHGSFFCIELKNPYDKISIFHTLLRRVLSEAKKINLPLTAGTSFGFDTTRIYVVASKTHYAKPFIRISVGTEDREEIERIAVVLEKSLASL